MKKILVIISFLIICILVFSAAVFSTERSQPCAIVSTDGESLKILRKRNCPVFVLAVGMDERNSVLLKGGEEPVRAGQINFGKKILVSRVDFNNNGGMSVITKSSKSASVWIFVVDKASGRAVLVHL